MKLSTLVAVTASLVGQAVGNPMKRQAANSDFTNQVIFQAPSNYNAPGTNYGRAAQIPDGSVISTWENYSGEPPFFPIFRSEDGGVSWTNYSSVQDTQNGWGLRWQPMIYVLPQQIGNYAEGTILIAGVSTPSDTDPAYIELYASTDLAQSWEFVSHVVYTPGQECCGNGAGYLSIWEPFMMVYENQLVIYYSDSTQPTTWSQKLSYVTSSDLQNWSSASDAVAYDVQDARPGMAVVAYIASTGQYILTFEGCGNNNCVIVYRVAANPLEFQNATDNFITVPDGNGGLYYPGNNPYVTWSQNPGSSSGTIIAGGESDSNVFICDDSANPNNWQSISTNGEYNAYSRSLNVVSLGYQPKLMIVGAGTGGSGLNAAICGVTDPPVS